MSDSPYAYPLSWPTGAKRTPAHQREDASYRVGYARTLEDLTIALDRFRARNVVLSTDQPLRKDGWPHQSRRLPDDPGVVLYCTIKGKDLCIPCDKFRTITSNVRAIWQVLEALRTIDRIGVDALTDRAFEGYARLPSKAGRDGRRPWRDVLGFPDHATPTMVDVRHAYREAARRHHPDRGGDAEKLAEASRAYEDAGEELSK